MEIGKEDSMRIFLEDRKAEAIKVRFSYTTKIQWWCLHCLKVIYVAYNQTSTNAIFCSECGKKRDSKKLTMVQYQYMMRLKTLQVKLIEDQLYSDENNKIN